MPDDTEDLGNDTPLLEGGDEFFSGIDSVLSTGASMAPDATDKPDAPKQVEQQQDDDAATQETPEQRQERERNEKGQFTAKEKADAEQAQAAKDQSQQQQNKEYPPEIKSPKAREHFDTLKRVKDEAERKASSLESKVKQFEARIQEMESKSGTAAPEVQVLQRENSELRAQLDDREKVISYKAVEASKPFQEQVTVPQEEAIDVLNQVAETYKLEGRALDAILKEPNKFKRLEMLGDLTAELPERSSFVKDELKEAVEKYVKAEGTAKSLYEKAKGNREFAEHEQRQVEAKAALDRAQQYQKANTEVDGILKEKFPEIAGDEATWKGIVEKAFKIADFDKMPPKAKAFANIASFMVMPLMEKLRASEAAHNATKEIMAKRNGSSLSPTQGRDAAVKKGVDEFDEGGDPMGSLMGGIDAVLGR